jgi:hypothetical protein
MGSGNSKLAFEMGANDGVTTATDAAVEVRSP